jgi:hypothetical protein
MQLAEELDDLPTPTGGGALDPYGQLIKMLMPRARSSGV